MMFVARGVFHEDQKNRGLSGSMFEMGSVLAASPPALEALSFSEIISGSPPPAGETVTNLGSVANDPVTQSMGYTSSVLIIDPDTGNEALAPVLGHSHDQNLNNDIRALVINSMDDTNWFWKTYQPTTAFSLTNSGSADNTTWVLDQDVLNRDNHAVVYWRHRNELWVYAGAAESGVKNNGIFNFTVVDPDNAAHKNWTHVWNDGSPNYSPQNGKFGAAADLIRGTLSNNLFNFVTGQANWTFHFNAAHAVNQDTKTYVQFGGSDGGGAARSTLVIIENNAAGPQPFNYTLMENPGGGVPWPPARERARNNCAIVGNYFYICCGNPDVGSDHSDLWRLDIPSRTWQQLASLPKGYRYGQMTYDIPRHQLVFYGGTATRDLYVYDIASDTWFDYTTDAALRYIDMPHGIYSETADMHIYRGGNVYNASGVQQVYTAALWYEAIRLPAVGSVGAENIEARLMPFRDAGVAGQIKHLCVDSIPGGRTYFCGGDWAGTPGGGSYRREVWSLDLETGNFTLEKGYCPPNSSTPWNVGRCQNAWVYDPQRQKFFIVSGNADNVDTTDCAVDYNQMLNSNAMWWNPSTRNWENISYTGTTGGRIKHGIWDAGRDRYLGVAEHTKISQWDPNTSVFSLVYDHNAATSGNPYLWSRGNMAVRGRDWYMIEEIGSSMTGFVPGLLKFNLDTDTMSLVTTNLPAPPRGLSVNGSIAEVIPGVKWPGSPRTIVVTAQPHNLPPNIYQDIYFSGTGTTIDGGYDGYAWPLSANEIECYDKQSTTGSTTGTWRVGNPFENCHILYWPKKDKLVYYINKQPNKLWFLDISSGAWTEKVLTPPDANWPIQGRTFFVDYRTGWLVIYGRNDIPSSHGYLSYYDYYYFIIKDVDI